MTKKEAIEIIKRNCTEDSLLRDACAIFVPELVENEDERIRKWLIEMVEELRKANPTNAEHNGNCSDAIAYLEKLKEQKLEDSEKKFESIDNAFRRGRETGFREGVESVKPAEWDRVDASTIEIVCDVLKYCFGPDEKLPCYFGGEWDVTRDTLIDRLKSLHPQSHWKPSEKQMDALRVYLYHPQYINNSEDIRIKLVESLYNDLKKRYEIH